MAPRKEKAEKTEKVTGDSANDLVLDYLRKQNRPYSATDVSANLHNKVTKTAAAKILKELHESKQIEGRAAGKQWVYHTIQPPTDINNASDLTQLDVQIETFKELNSVANANIKSLRASLATLSSTLSTADLLTSIDDLTKIREDLTTRLAELKSGNVKPVTVEEMSVVDAEMKKWQGVAGRRLKIVRDVWGQIAEGLDTEKIAEMREEFGLD